MLNKTQLKEIFAGYNFAPLKRLGENYLIDGNIKNKIIAAADVVKDDAILEIGPGFGALTIDLAEAGAKVIAVEKDRKACSILTDLALSDFPNLRIINGDILDFDLDTVFEMPSNGRAGLPVRRSLGEGGNLPYSRQVQKRIKVIGNLPYYITTPVIEFILNNRRLIDLAVIMVQKEVAARLLAKPGTKDYSSLSCFAQYYAGLEYIYTVKRTCFYPAPEVDSAIVKLDMTGEPPVRVGDEELFFRIVRGAFNQRRKSIINSLSREAVLNTPKEKLTAVLKNAGVDPIARPETLSLADFARIANSVIFIDNLTNKK